MINIKLKINDVVVELSIAEAKKLYGELAVIFGNNPTTPTQTYPLFHYTTFKDGIPKVTCEEVDD